MQQRKRKTKKQKKDAQHQTKPASSTHKGSILYLPPGKREGIERKRERKQKKKILHPHESGPICSHLASSLIDVLHWRWCTQLQKIFHRFCSCLIRTKPPTQGQKKGTEVK